MRLFPILTAAVVMAVLYLLVFERDRMLRFAGGSTEAQASEAAPAAPADKPGAAVVKVVALHSKAETVPNGVLMRGRTEAARSVDVRSETSGQVVSDPLRKGALVAPGDVLCRLNPGTREVSLAEAKSRLAEAQARLPEAEARVQEAAARLPESRARLPEAEARLTEAKARQVEAELSLMQAETLKTQGFASESRVKATQAALQSAKTGVQSAMAGVEAVRTGLKSAEAAEAQARAGVESAKAGIQAAEAGVAAAENEISRLTITVPFAGLLESDAAETGALLQPGALCATVVRLDPIKLVGFVPETEVSRVETGALAGARLADGREVRGKVTYVARTADEATRTFRVEVAVPNADNAIRDGQTAEIVVTSDGVLAHLLPSSSLTLNDEGVLGIRAVAEGKASFRPVEVMRDTVDGIWVTGLPAEIDVIVVGQEFVTDGVPVEATFRETM